MKPRQILDKILFPLLALALFFAVWAIAAALLGVEIILPSPGAALRQFFALFADARFWRSLGASVLRTLAGFAVSFVVAFALAVAARLSKNFSRFLSPVVTILRSVPTIAVIFIVLVFLPASRVPVLISFLIVFPMLYESFLTALCGVSPEISEMSRLYRVPVSVRIRRFFVPAILPEVFSVSRSAIGLNLKVVVAAEAIASTGTSLGRLLQIANIELDSAMLFAYTIMAVLISFALEGLVLLVRKLVVRWR